MLTPRRFPSFLMGVVLLFTGWIPLARAEGILPSHEQEFTDARAALDAARSAQADKYAPEPMKQAQEYLATAQSARQPGDAVKFSQASRLARAYAELARAIAEFNTEMAQMAQTNEELQKTKTEIERLKKSQ